MCARMVPDMTKKEKERMRDAFFRKAGHNSAMFKAMMDALPNAGFYLKDAEGRFMALNRRNCDICNIRDEFDREEDLISKRIIDDFQS